MPTKIIMPQLGKSVVEGTISKWLKQEGEAVQEMDSLLEVNTDKVDTEIPSPSSGVLLKITVPEGETVRAGTVIAWIGKPGEAVPEGEAGPGSQKENKAAEPVRQGKGAAEMRETEPVPAGAPREKQEHNGHSRTVEPALAPGRSQDLGFISPIVARLAQENDLDLSKITGTGDGGRITKKDVLAYLKDRPAAAAAQAAAPAPWETPGEGDLFRPTEMVFGKTGAAEKTGAVQTPPKPAKTAAGKLSEVQLPGEGQLIPLNNMRRQIAENMVISKRSAPHVTTVMEANLQRVLAHYQANKAEFAKQGVKLTYTAYFVAAAVQALRAFPMVNSSWTDNGIQVHPQINLGLAVSLGEQGLIVPVIKNAGDLSLQGIARVVADLADRARNHQLRPEEVREGTFTITNHGIAGSLFATPIINQPQAAILGVGAVQKRVVVVADENGDDLIAVRPMVYLSLTFDHRILDGASADGFLAKIVSGLAQWH